MGASLSAPTDNPPGTYTTAEYDPNRGNTLTTIFRFKLAGFDKVLISKDWWLAMTLHITISLAYGYNFIPEEAAGKHSSWSFEGNNMRVITALALFQLVFNSKMVYSRYDKLNRLSGHLLENVVKTTWLHYIICGRTCGQYVSLASRYHVAAASCFFTNISVSYGPDLSTAAKMGVLNEGEKAYLEHFDPEFVPLLLMQWVQDVIKEGYIFTRKYEVLDALKRDSNFKSLLVSTERSMKYMQKVKYWHEFRTPWQNFQLMSLMIFVCICLWAYFMGITHSYLANLAFVGVSLIFINAQRVARHLQDPFGGWPGLDFPVDDWLHDLHNDVQFILDYEPGLTTSWADKANQQALPVDLSDAAVGEDRFIVDMDRAIGNIAESSPLLQVSPEGSMHSSFDYFPDKWNLDRLELERSRRNYDDRPAIESRGKRASCFAWLGGTRRPLRGWTW